MKEENSFLSVQDHWDNIAQDSYLLNVRLTRFVWPQVTAIKFLAKYRASRKTTFEKLLLRQSFDVNKFIQTFHRIVTCSMLVYFIYVLYRSSHRRCSVEKGILKNFANFTGKRPCRSVFLIKFVTDFVEKRPRRRCLSVKFAKFLRTPI